MKTFNEFVNESKVNRDSTIFNKEPNVSFSFNKSTASIWINGGSAFEVEGIKLPDMEILNYLNYHDDHGLSQKLMNDVSSAISKSLDEFLKQNSKKIHDEIIKYLINNFEKTGHQEDFIDHVKHYYPTIWGEIEKDMNKK